MEGVFNKLSQQQNIMNYPQITQINADYKNVFYFNLRNLR